MPKPSGANFDFERMISKILREVPFNDPAPQPAEVRAEEKSPTTALPECVPLEGYTLKAKPKSCLKSIALTGDGLVSEIVARRVHLLEVHIVPGVRSAEETAREKEQTWAAWCAIRDSREGQAFLLANPYYLTEADRKVFADWCRKK